METKLRGKACFMEEIKDFLSRFNNAGAVM